MSLLSWVYNHKEQLSIEFSTDDWSSKFGLKLFDYESSIKHNNMEFYGRGVDEVESVAILKSVSEVIERVICNEYGITSVGLSIQSTQDNIFDSDSHAKDEILERYFLKKHIENGVPFRMIEATGPMVSEFKKHNSSSKMQFFKMNTPVGYYGVGCLLELNDKASIGFAFSYIEIKTIEKAFTEALPNLFWLQENDIKDEEKPFHLQLSFISKVKSLLGLTATNIKIETQLPDIVGQKIDLSEHGLFATAPIRITSFRIKENEID